MKKLIFSKRSALATLAITAVVSLAGLMMAQTAPSLGVADSFAVLAGASIVDINPSVITGDAGLSPASGTFIGITSPEVSDTIYAVDATGPDGAAGNTQLSLAMLR